jgi:hypothetical protein
MFNLEISKQLFLAKTSDETVFDTSDNKKGFLKSKSDKKLQKFTAPSPFNNEGADKN